MAFKFEDLRVWQNAVDFTYKVHQLTAKFPADEKYVLTPQIKRAADSIALNIAEGSTGQSNAEFNRFLGMALRSAIEVVSCLYIGRKRNAIVEEDFQTLYKELELIIKQVQALRKTLK